MSLQDRLMNGRIKAAQDKAEHEMWCANMRQKLDQVLDKYAEYLVWSNSSGSTLDNINIIQ